MLPPNNISVPELAKQEGISKSTLYTWRSQLKKAGSIVQDNRSSDNKWSGEAKFMVVIETAKLSESELSQYCREKGLYPEQVKEWRSACIRGSSTLSNDTNNNTSRGELKAAKDQIKKLEKELKYKEKALAETAALLVLRKKLNALWGEGSEDA